jgi:ABC-type uncharacterized transport system permease subunit
MSKTRSAVTELRRFVVTVSLALGILGAILVWRKRDIGFMLWGIGSAALVIGWVRPTVLRPLYKYWMKLALALGFVTSHIVLALLYYLVFTPMGLVMRAVGKNPLSLHFDEKTESYWIKRENRKYDRQSYEKMF